MSCSCNDKGLDVCDEPKVSAQQLDMLRSMIKCLCKCEDTPVDVPEEEVPDIEVPEEEVPDVDVPSCAATYLTGKPIDGFPDRITYSKNGGPFREIVISDMEPDGFPSFSHMFKNESLTGFAFAVLDSFYENTNMLVEFCGLNPNGSFVTSVEPNGINPPALMMVEGVYEGPFNVIAEKNTLTFKATEGVPDYKDFFHCLDNPTGASTLTVESCAVLEVPSLPVPPSAV